MASQRDGHYDCEAREVGKKVHGWENELWLPLSVKSGMITYMPETENETRGKIDSPVVDSFNDGLDQREELDGVIARLAVDLTSVMSSEPQTLSLTWMFSGCMSMSMTSVKRGIG